MVLNEERHSQKVEPCHTVLNLLARADRLVPARKESLYWRAWAYYELGDYEASRAEYERTVRLEGPFVDSIPNVGKVLLNLAQDYMKAGFPRRALAAYDDSLYWWEWACRMEPEKAQHWRGSASALGMLGRIDEAREAFRRALDLEGDPIQKQRIFDLTQRLETDAEALRKQAESYFSEDPDQ